MIELTEKVRKRFEIQLKNLYVGQPGIKRDRPKLNQIHYSGDGHVEITNTMSAVRLSDVHEKQDSDDGYPNMDGIFKVPNNVDEFEFKMKELKEFEDHLNVIYRNKVEAVKVKINSDGILISEQHPGKESVFVESGIKIKWDMEEELEFAIHPRYLHDALNMFRLIGVKELSIFYDTARRPIHLVSDNLHYLIMPLTFKNGGE